MRHSIAHQVRSASGRYRMAARRCVTEAEAISWLSKLANWQNSRWSKRGIPSKLECPARRLFYEQFVRGLFGRNQLSCWALFADDQLVAVELGCRSKDCHVGIHSGFDPAMATLSPGVILQAFLLQSLIGDRMARYDFGSGNEGYKLRWANEPECTFPIFRVRSAGVEWETGCCCRRPWSGFTPC